MQTITQKKKLSKGTWVLVFLVIGVIIAVAVLAAVGYIDLGFLTADDMENDNIGLLVSYSLFGTSGWINALIVILLPFAAGMILAVILYRYFIGQKVTVAAGQSVYTPQTGASVGTNSGTSTEVS
jgi:preprotein translocase subunit SecG